MRTAIALALFALLTGASTSPAPSARTSPSASAPFAAVSPSPSPPRATPSGPTASFPPNAFVIPGDISFIGAREGWIGVSDLSGSFTFDTEDGGVSWTRLPTPGAEHVLQFVDHDHGWLVSTSIYRTADGGRSWQVSFAVTGPGSGMPLGGSFSAVDPTHAWITHVPADCNVPLCAPEVFRTTDGSNWTVIGVLPQTGRSNSWTAPRAGQRCTRRIPNGCGIDRMKRPSS